MAVKKSKSHLNGSNGAAKATQLLIEKTRCEFDGRAYNLVMTNGALIEFEKLTGLSSLMDGDKIYDKPSLHTICAMLYVLIKRDGSPLTHEQVIERMTQKQAGPVFRAILAARMVAFAKEEKQDPSMPTTASLSS